MFTLTMALYVFATAFNHARHLTINWIEAEFGLCPTGCGLLDVQFIGVGELQSLQEPGLALYQV